MSTINGFPSSDYEDTCNKIIDIERNSEEISKQALHYLTTMSKEKKEEFLAKKPKFIKLRRNYSENRTELGIED